MEQPTPPIIKEYASFKNPRALRSDDIPTTIKVAFKEGIASWGWFRAKSTLQSLAGIQASSPHYKYEPKNIGYLWQWISPLIYGVVVPLIGGIVKSLVLTAKFLRHPIKPFTHNQSIFDNHHDILIPETKNHATWILGAQPSELTISNIETQFHGRRTHIISMLAGKERALVPSSEQVISKNGAVYLHGSFQDRTVDRLPWGDHGTASLLTAEGQPVKNQTVESMIAYQKELYPHFNTIPSQQTSEAFYCHCMAGKSRSYVESMTFFFFHPNKEQLFDFENWPPEITKTIPDDLKYRLRNNPSFSDISEFISIRRPQVKVITKMDGDQAGLLGLMSLEAMTQNGLRNTKGDAQGESRLLKDAQNIGLMLNSSLDRAFRNPKDRERQESNLIDVYKKFQAHKPSINLLTAMVVPIGQSVDLSKYNINSDQGIKDFEVAFFEKRKLGFFAGISHAVFGRPKSKPIVCYREQTRFALLLKTLEDAAPPVELGKLRGMSTAFAARAAKNADEISAGDQVELLRAFPSLLKLTDLSYKNIAKKILAKGVDNYNAGIQLTELLHLARINNSAENYQTIEKIVQKMLSDSKLSKEEKGKLDSYIKTEEAQQRINQVPQKKRPQSFYNLLIQQSSAPAKYIKDRPTTLSRHQHDKQKTLSTQQDRRTQDDMQLERNRTHFNTLV